MYRHSDSVDRQHDIAEEATAEYQAMEEDVDADVRRANEVSIEAVARNQSFTLVVTGKLSSRELCNILGSLGNVIDKNGYTNYCVEQIFCNSPTNKSISL